MKTEASFPPHRILCPVDLSELSSLALKYAAAGARAFDAELTVLHAIQLELPAYFTQAEAEQFRRQQQAARKAARSHLAAHAKRILGATGRDLPTRFQVVEASPARAILEAVEKAGHDLVVMGTHGRTAAKRFFLGSVTESVVRHATVPVFVVRQKQHDFLDPHSPALLPRLKKILCPVNRTDAARACLEKAAVLANRFQAHLTVLRVIEGDKTTRLDQARSELCAWIPKNVSSQCSFEPQLRRGRAAEQIVDFAAKAEQDLIVLGAPARARLGSWLFGETTELVLRHAPCPVLVVPEVAQ